MDAYESEGRTIVYLDESGFVRDEPRTHGYCYRGKRCHGIHDWPAKGRINVIGAMVGFILVSVGLFEGSINSNVFYAWLTQALVPVGPVNAVVMDNASFHKRADMVEAIQPSGVLLEFLPPYSPDLNPIEKKWAQAKATKRREQCTTEELFDADFF